MPPLRHGFGEQTFIVREHLGGRKPVGQTHRKPNVPTFTHIPPFKHGFNEHPSVVVFDGIHPNGPIPFPVKCGGQVQKTPD